MKMLSALLIALFASIGSSAWAECTIAADPVASTAQAYDPFSATPTQIVFEVAVKGTGDAGCPADIVLKPVNGTTRLVGPGGIMNYSFISPTGLTSGSTIGPVGIVVPLNDRATTSFIAEIPAGSVVSPGDYSADITVSILVNGVPAVQDRVVTLKAIVRARAQMSISGTSAPGRGSIGMAPPAVSFGTLETGEDRTVFVNVWANSSVRVRLSSLNGGVLKHDELASLPSVPYTVEFDHSAPQTLASAIAIARPPPMSMAGASYPLVLTIGNVAGRFAGHYTDEITVSVDEN